MAVIELIHPATAPQRAFMEATEPYVDFEGSVRSGKTTFLCRKVRDYCLQYPGICCALARYTQDGLDAQLKPRWREILSEAGQAGRVEWHAEEQYDEFPNGSRCYLRAMKSSDETQRFAKLAGLTLAVLGIDQAEEVPDDVYRAYVPARLSQVGYIHQVLLTPNPPGEDSWIASEFPDPDDHGVSPLPGHRYIRAELWDMERILGRDYVNELVTSYRRKGYAYYRRFVEGRRGLAAVGEPVYAGYFSRDRHVVERGEYLPMLPIYEGWDFGHRHPAVVWAQSVDGQWRILGEVLGTSEGLTSFSEWALQVRSQLFPDAVRFESVCDPSGYNPTGHGLEQTAVTLLQDKGVILPPRELVKHYNTQPMQNGAIQHTMRLMGETLKNGRPAFQIDSRCRTLITGFEAGYIWDDRTMASAKERRPDKMRDTMYHHLQDCWEYIVMRFGSAKITREQAEHRLARLEGAALRRAQIDHGEKYHWHPKRAPRAGY